MGRVATNVLVYVRNVQQRGIQSSNLHIESNAHVAGMLEIIWAILPVKESMKTTSDGSNEAKEVFESVSRLLQPPEDELEQLITRTTGIGRILSQKQGWWSKNRRSYVQMCQAQG